MGQVCGKINNHECEWISIQEQERRFSNHKLVDVYLGLGRAHIHHELFDHQIAHLIKDYATVDDNWSKACKIIDQDRVRAFPEEHISEIGDPDFVFYFTPEGSLNEFRQKIIRYAAEIFGAQCSVNPLIIECWIPIYHDNNYFNSHHDAKWILMRRELLEGSRNKTYTEQKKLAQEKGITLPSIQAVVKTLLLDNAVNLRDALEENDELRRDIQTEKPEEIILSLSRPLFSPPGFTRIKESDNSELSTPRHQLQTPKHWLIGGNSDRLQIFSIPYDACMGSCGLAVVKEF